MATSKPGAMNALKRSRPLLRRRVAPPRTGADLLSPLSDELLVRILSFLPLQHLLAVFPVSRRFYHLAGDSQLWKALYYSRFVLPRAMRIPGFRDGPATGGAGHKLHYSGRRTLWADGRRGGIVRDEDVTRQKVHGQEDEDDTTPRPPGREEVLQRTESVNWKRQYKLRYNWSRGKCAVEELRIGSGEVGHREEQQERKILAKVLEGIAITADKAAGLRAWDLRGRKLLAQMELGDSESEAGPSCIAVDDGRMGEEILDVAVGFVDGSFGVWRLHVGEGRLVLRYRHKGSSNGELIAMALAYPYLLTATASVLVSLYTFDVPETKTDAETEGEDQQPRGRNVGLYDGIQRRAGAGPTPEKLEKTPADGGETLVSPYLLTSLNSHTSRPPLALSIRKTSATTVASIAYTFSTRQGWSIGIQDLHIRSVGAGTKSAPEITTTRIAYTNPVDSGSPSRTPASSPRTPGRHTTQPTLESSPPLGSTTPETTTEPGPTTLCYTHPYLLATLPDNTLVLHMCTSNASSLSISRGIRLWGHTSGISDAEITARGKAVSVSSRGEEMRVWELEGRSNGVGSRSVEIKPGQALTDDDLGAAYDWDERRNWVGFDDEMVIVLKEKTGGGKESLMVYDFT
ncbi:hypothetical protein B0T16DRAFT_424209 [Cercophora newfieldiana]|uniref:F-box domain-containing protein n=1 Tax=Cercophora newfieldiana TaxID=92897 RepID=A0AA40CYG9_9PEZI|nr:hypothetical protein B0T16DRAFT_424209 [Cercophora newfieldiana]